MRVWEEREGERKGGERERERERKGKGRKMSDTISMRRGRGGKVFLMSLVLENVL